MGHPLGATGAMIFGTALDELERRDLSTALVTLCIGAGMGTATIIERVVTESGIARLRREPTMTLREFPRRDVDARRHRARHLGHARPLDERLHREGDGRARRDRRAVAADAAIKGAVIVSGKKDFSGGADITMIHGLFSVFADMAKEATARSRAQRELFDE